VQNPESLIKQTAATTEQFLVMPLSLSPHNQVFGAEFHSDLAVQQLSSHGPAFVRLETNLAYLITPTGAYPDAIKSGSYEQVRNLAATKAAEASELLTDYRSQEALSITDAFAVHGLMSFMATLNRPHPSKAPYSSDRTTYFLTHFAGGLAQHVGEQELRDSPDTYDIVTGLQNVGERLGRAIGEPPEWVTQKFHTLSEYLSIRKHAMSLIEAEPTVEVDDIAELTRNNDALFKELNRLRCYSIKSAVHQDGDVAWSIHDGIDYHVQRGAIAADSEIKLGDWPPHFKFLAVEQLADTEHVYVVDTVADQRKISREGFGRIIFMDGKGQLYADHNAIFSYEDLYAKAGKAANYQALRQKMLRYYFDLTVPTEVVRQVINDENRFLGNTASSEIDKAREPGQVIYSDFLMPRVRRLKSFKTIGQMERFESDVPVENPNKKKLDLPLYSVEAHPRTLPPGYTPSREALKLAEQLGIELEPGQTLVKKHDRGDAKNGVVTHKGKRRK